MNNTSSATLSAALEPIETQIPTPEEQNDSPEVHYYYEDKKSFFKQGTPFYLLIIGMLVVMLIMNAIELHQYKQYTDVVAQEAYVLSVSINLLEDNLLFNYGLLPEDLGLMDLRNAWISDACQETAMSYYEALKEAWDYFEGNPGNFNTFELILV